MSDLNNPGSLRFDPHSIGNNTTNTTSTRFYDGEALILEELPPVPTEDSAGHDVRP